MAFNNNLLAGNPAALREGTYRTPIGDLKIDTAVYAELHATGQFVGRAFSVVL